MFLNTPLNKEYHILIKISYLVKEYIAQKLLSEFPGMSRTKSLEAAKKFKTPI